VAKDEKYRLEHVRLPPSPGLLVADTRSMLGAEKTMGRLQEAMGTIQAMLAGLPAADEFVALWMEVRHALLHASPRPHLAHSQR
jgi:hypothetical protein